MRDARAVDALIAGLADMAGEDPPLRHIFHVAGVNSPMTFAALTAEALHEEMAAKVGGAWALHDAVERHRARLDTFVLYGSISGVWGNGGQAAYGAANAGLTGLARHRRARGLPATVLHWGPWADSGMVTDRVVAASPSRSEAYEAAGGTESTRAGARRGPRSARRCRCGLGVSPGR